MNLPNLPKQNELTNWLKQNIFFFFCTCLVYIFFKKNVYSEAWCQKYWKIEFGFECKWLVFHGAPSHIVGTLSPSLDPVSWWEPISTTDCTNNPELPIQKEGLLYLFQDFLAGFFHFIYFFNNISTIFFYSGPGISFLIFVYAS